MLFNSFAFLLVFLPLSLVLHGAVERFRPDWRVPLLVVLSLAFYGYWDWRFVPLLVGSIVVNWCVAEAFLKQDAPKSVQGRAPTSLNEHDLVGRPVPPFPDHALASRRGLLIPAAIAANLLLLAFFKYFNFFAGLAEIIPGLHAPRLDWALPLGISFFTFHHVMYLSDLKAGRAPRFGLLRYAFYIGFFPQVLAGPLVRWSEVMHQLDERPYQRPDAAERFARGLMLLTLGLMKKVFIGDPLAGYVNPVFQAAAEGKLVTFLDAWQATLGFTLQIYFDFSGYTDMALGLALLFGIVLPQNFDVPYRSASLQDFWRRWHMTLSRFLRDYLYVPLGGNRRGLAVQVMALFATMALGGLWHGAGLTFVAWGVAHGLGLGAGVLWKRAGLRMPSVAGWFLTLLFVALTWVLFRAPSFEVATEIYRGLFGLTSFGYGFKWRTLALAGAVALIGPTAWALVHRLPPRRWIAIGFAILMVVVLFKIGDDANYEFIYFQF